MMPRLNSEINEEGIRSVRQKYGDPRSRLSWIVSRLLCPDERGFNLNAFLELSAAHKIKHEKAFILRKTTGVKRKNLMTPETSKILGGVGALLMFIGVIPYVSYYGAVEIIGAILVLVALYGLGSHYKESGIFNNAIYGVIIGVVGVILAVSIGIAIVLPNITDFVMKIYPSWNGDWSTIPSLSGMTPNTSNIGFGDIVPFIVAGIVIFVILWVFAIIATFFLRRSFNQVSTKSNVGLFGTAGLLLLIGAFLVIIIIGLILMWIAALILAIAFFSLKTAQPPPP
jgi:uncharacterized membrane protein